MKKAIITITALLACLSLDAQGFLNISPDPVSASLAYTGVARKADAYAMDNNIAATVLDSPRMAAAAGFGMWQPSGVDAKILSAQGYYRIGERLSFGAQFKNFAYHEYSIVSEDGRVKGSFPPKEMAAGLGFAYLLADGLSAGVNVRMVSSTMAADAKATAVGADIALQYAKDSFSAGLSLNNLGSALKYGERSVALPIVAKAGAAYSVQALTLSAEADYFVKGGIAAGVGAEYTILDIVSLRAGYHYGNSAGTLASFASLGLGVQFAGVQLNFAYLTASQTLGNSLMLSLGYSF